MEIRRLTQADLNSAPPLRPATSGCFAVPKTQTLISLHGGVKA